MSLLNSVQIDGRCAPRKDNRNFSYTLYDMYKNARVYNNVANEYGKINCFMICLVAISPQCNLICSMETFNKITDVDLKPFLMSRMGVLM